MSDHSLLPLALHPQDSRKVTELDLKLEHVMATPTAFIMGSFAVQEINPHCS